MPFNAPLGGSTLDVLVQGYPGKTVCHGGLGWSTIALVRTGGRAIVFDVGSFGVRKTMIALLAGVGLAPEDVTDVVLSHAHWDHAVNWVTFSAADIWIGGAELDWALTEPFGRALVPELYIQALAGHPRLRRVSPGDEILPGLTAHLTAGHTPGHLTYLFSAAERDVVFAGDAAKNRAEIMSRTADMTLDAAQSTRSIEAIWALWQRRPDSVLVPGHDAPMVLRDGRPHYVTGREGGIVANVGDTMEEVRTFDLTF